MLYNIVIYSVVYGEISEAIAYYESISPELGNKFESSLQNALDKLEIQPMHYYNLNDRKHRRIVLNKFPYALIYSVDGQQVIVKMLFFQLRNPQQLWERLKL